MKLPQLNLFQRYRVPAVYFCSAIFVLLAAVLPADAQIKPAPPAVVAADPPARNWVESAADHESHIIKNDGLPLRYCMHKVDSKEDITREIIETSDGNVARLLERNGQKLTAEEDAAERERLNQILASPADFVRHHKRDDSTRNDSLQLVKEMPRAMVFSYTPNQPQLPGATRKQVVIDYHPDPNYQPQQTLDDLLTGIEGRMWIDAESHRVVRIEGHVLHPVNFGWGILGKIYPGGTIELEQANASGDRWAYSKLEVHLNMRVIVKQVPVNNHMTAYDFQPLPGPVTVQQAVQMLLAMPVPLR
jgi:hypothetical protein